MKNMILLGNVLIFCTACIPPGLQEPAIVRMYEGPIRPIEEVAVIGAASPAAQTTMIDGVNWWGVLLKEHGGTGPSRSKGIHVLPGKHVVKVMSQPIPVSVGYKKVAFHSEASYIEIRLKAGHTYLPRTKVNSEGKVEPWLEDMGPNFDRDCLRNRQGCP